MRAAQWMKMLLLWAVLAGPVLAQSNADEESSLRSEFEKRRLALPADDAAGRYQLALWAMDQYSDKTRNIEALELTVFVLERALKIDPELPHAKSLLKTVKHQHKAVLKTLEPDYWAMAFSVIGGLGIFLLGMKNMSEGMQALAGQRLRRLISAVTDNRFLGVGAGTAVTMLVQSSSITTVIVVGFVNSGLMALHQAIAVIMGANIGTTITGWILVLKIGKYGLPIIGISAIAYLFSKSDRWRYLAMAVLGLGLVFFGLEMMSSGFKPMRDAPSFVDAFVWFRADTYFGVLKCAMVGCILTFIVQSSSATLGITIGLASTGVIPFETAAALVLGENIGTTITAWLASIGATTNAKRAAYAHVLFNVLGVAWITAVFSVYIRGVGAVVGWFEGTSPLGLTFDPEMDPVAYATIVTAGIAATHTGFNVINTLMFVPLVRIYARLLERMIPDRGKEVPHLTRLDIRLIESPMIGIEQARGEVLKMADGVEKMHVWTREILQQKEPNMPLVNQVFHREKVMDNVQHEVIDFVTDLMTGEVPHAVAEEGRQLLRLADEYESISDYISAVLKGHLKLDHEQKRLTESELADLLSLHDRVDSFVRFVNQSVRDSREVLSKAQTEGEAITHQFKDLREAHLLKITSPERVDPAHSMAYSAMLNAYRKIKEHALNVAEAQAGHK